MIYLYAIIDHPEAPVRRRSGMEGAPISALCHENIAAVISPFVGPKVAVTEDNAWLHEQIVECLMEGHTVLPARFGSVLPDEQALGEALTAHYRGFVSNLRGVCGCVEVGLRVLWDAAPPPGPAGQPEPGRRYAGGREYLAKRLEEERQRNAQRQEAEDLVAALHAPLAEASNDSVRRVLITPRLLLTAAYLVRRDQLSTFRQRVDGLGQSFPQLQVLCTGPWPAYSFVHTGAADIRGGETP